MHLIGSPLADSGSRLRSRPRSFSLPDSLDIGAEAGDDRAAGVDADRSDMAYGRFVSSASNKFVFAGVLSSLTTPSVSGYGG